MNPISHRRILAVLLLLAGGAPGTSIAGFKVEVLYDHGADFSAFETYRWVTGPLNETPEAQLVDRHIKQTANAELAERGLRLAAEGDAADLLLTYYGGTEENLLIEGVRFELAPHVVWTGADPRDVTHRYRVGTLVLDFADAETEKIIWSGVVRTRASTVRELRSRVEKAVRRVLKKYPPE